MHGYYALQDGEHVIIMPHAKSYEECALEGHPIPAISVAHNIDINTLGQYTGLKDINGKEIYEGDIVRKLIWSEEKYLETNNGQCYDYAKISYVEELGGFYLVNRNDKICWEIGQDKNSIEVCGNIYENTELLKEKL